jgi:cytochrome c oxidase cbb3-type subunit 3
MSESKLHDPIQGEIVHEYDGIQEADNRLPLWWLWTFYAAILFSIGYWFYYEEFEAAPGLAGQYYADKAAEAEKSGKEPTKDELLAMIGTPAAAHGKETFQTLCSACHEADGRGKIGPNLTDDRWLHGGSELDVFHSIRDGVPEKGMPAWGPTLGSMGVQEVTAFVLSIRDSNVQGKAPEGEVYAPEAAEPKPEKVAPSETGGDAAPEGGAPRDTPARAETAAPDRQMAAAPDP